MTQVSKYPISENLFKKISDLLAKVITDSMSMSDAKELLQDLLTPIERIMIAKRLAVAILLTKKFTYRQIQDILHISTPTINDINSALKSGSKGYAKFVQKILKEEKNKEFWNKIDKFFLKNLAKTNKGNHWKYLYDEVKDDKSTTYI